MTCNKCNRPMLPRPSKPANRTRGVLYHYGRGLCSKCYAAANRNGTLTNHERLNAAPGTGERYYQDVDADRRCLEAWLWERRARITRYNLAA